MRSLLEDNPNLFLGSRLKRLAEQMQADASAFTCRAGLSVPPGMFAVLAILEEHGAQTISALAEALGVSQPSMTKNVTKLARAALVRVTKGDLDRRQSIVTLTATGRHAVSEGRERVWPLVDAAVHEIVSDLSGPFIEQIGEVERRLAVRSISHRAAAKAAVELHPATDEDIPAVVLLLNRAYRGSGDQAAWNSEAAYIDGDRANEEFLRGELSDHPRATLLVWRFWNEVQGCVWLEPQNDDTWYLGSLAVDPALQNGQAGRRLLAAAEAWVLTRGGTRIRMTVVNVRDTLIAWYERRGYRLTGETEPFPYADERFGRPKRPDLHFVVLAKDLHA